MKNTYEACLFFLIDYELLYGNIRCNFFQTYLPIYLPEWNMYAY